MAGMLYLCATPIGNLRDITGRVLDTLASVDLIACEDTRTSRILLDHYGIKTPVTSYHEHNAAQKGEILISRLLAGENIALITDAGTPAISDPGERLVLECIENGIAVTSLPGPSALITALTLSGLPARRFVFEGFLPREKKERDTVLESLAGEMRTVIFYEAPHRLLQTLKILYETLGDRKIALCRELTKKFETVEHTTLSEALAGIDPETGVRGEYVVVLAGASEEEIRRKKSAWFKGLSVSEHVAKYEAEGADRKEAMRLCAKDRGVSRREIYRLLEEEK